MNSFLVWMLLPSSRQFAQQGGIAYNPKRSKMRDLPLRIRGPLEKESFMTKSPRQEELGRNF